MAQQNLDSDVAVELGLTVAGAADAATRHEERDERLRQPVPAADIEQSVAGVGSAQGAIVVQLRVELQTPEGVAGDEAENALARAVLREVISGFEIEIDLAKFSRNLDRREDAWSRSRDAALLSERVAAAVAATGAVRGGYSDFLSARN